MHASDSSDARSGPFRNDIRVGCDEASSNRRAQINDRRQSHRLCHRTRLTNPLALFVFGKTFARASMGFATFVIAVESAFVGTRRNRCCETGGHAGTVVLC